MKTYMIGAVLAGIASAAASANTMTLTFTGVNPGVNVSYSYNGSGFTQTTAGLFNWQGGVKTFCTQLNENISINQTVTFGVVAPELVPEAVAPGSPNPGPMGAIKATVLRDLYARNYNLATLVGSNIAAAAFQLVVWEISHETLTQGQDAAAFAASLNLLNGTFKVKNNTNAAVLAAANALLNSLGGQNGDDFLDFANLRGLTHVQYQDQLIVVPVPAPALLAGLGLLGGVVARRRMKKV
jgi:hypothetical protein